MIVREYFRTRKDGVVLYKTYSDADLKIKQAETGNIYNYAIDVEDALFTYEETNEKIDDIKKDEETEMAGVDYE